MMLTAEFERLRHIGKQLSGSPDRFVCLRLLVYDTDAFQTVRLEPRLTVRIDYVPDKADLAEPALHIHFQMRFSADYFSGRQPLEHNGV